MNTAEVPVDRRVNRFPQCAHCAVVYEAAQNFATGNVAIAAVVVNNCTPSNLETAVVADMTGLEMVPGGDLFHPEQGRMVIYACPGRVAQHHDSQANLTSGSQPVSE